MNFKKCLVVLISTVIMTNHSAIAMNFNDILEVNSDDLVINKSLNSASFKGHVIVKFDKILLETDLIIVHYNSKKQKEQPVISKIEIPHKLSAIYGCQGDVILADKGEYDGDTNKLTLTGNVKANKDNNVLSTNKLVYITSFKKIASKK